MDTFNFNSTFRRISFGQAPMFLHLLRTHGHIITVPRVEALGRAWASHILEIRITHCVWPWQISLCFTTVIWLRYIFIVYLNIVWLPQLESEHHESTNYWLLLYPCHAAVSYLVGAKCVLDTPKWINSKDEALDFDNELWTHEMCSLAFWQNYHYKRLNFIICFEIE